MRLRMILKRRLKEFQLSEDMLDQAEQIFNLVSRLPCEGEDWRDGGCPSRENGVCRCITKLDLCAVLDMTMHLIKSGVRVERGTDDERKP